MRVTFILPNASMGGGTRVVSIYSQLLARRGHSVCVVSLPTPGPTKKEQLKSWLRRDRSSTGTPPASHFDDLSLDHRILDKWRPVVDHDLPDSDVVIATWWETAEWVSELAPQKGAKVYFIQGHEVFPYLPVERSRATYRLPLHKVVVAEWLREVMEREYGDHTVDVVPNSVDRSQFSSPERGKQAVPTAGLIYSSSSLKGVDLSLTALENLRVRLPNLHIVSFGSEQMRAGLRLPDYADFSYNPPQNKLSELYSRCDVWVTASKTEGFNLPAMEAMACRTPVVSTRTGWPAEVIRSGWNGVLVDVDDLDGLTGGIDWILSRSDREWRVLSENAHATVSSSSWENSVEKFERALRHACERRDQGEV